MQTHEAANTLSVPSEARRSRASSFPALLLFGPTGTSVAARRARGSNAFPNGPCIPKPGTEIDDPSSRRQISEKVKSVTKNALFPHTLKRVQSKKINAD